MASNVFVRKLNKSNIDKAIDKYKESIKNIGDRVKNKTGAELLHFLKREKVTNGPYPHVSLSEAANRIMTDLVILHGIKWLLDNNTFDFDSYTVEYGIENNNKHDIIAKKNGHQLNGEAFNVAKSSFQGKKTSMLKKLQQSESTYKLILTNSDAVSNTYKPKLKSGEYFVFVDIKNGEAELFK